MTRTAAWALALWLAWPAGVGAHRLDEYLQATRVSLVSGAVLLEIDLTPGVQVAERVVALIDADGDGRLSPAERDGYAARVVASTALEIDRQRVRIALVDATFPPVEELRAGTGAIHLRARASAWGLSRGAHELRYFNLHAPEMSAYLVNALMPPEGIAITGQRRDPWQREFNLAFTTGARASGWSHAWPWSLAGIGLLLLVAGRGRWPRSSRSVPLLVVLAVVVASSGACGKTSPSGPSATVTSPQDVTSTATWSSSTAAMTTVGDFGHSATTNSAVTFQRDGC